MDPRRPLRQDTFDLRDQIITDDSAHMQAHADAAAGVIHDEEQRSMLDDDSDGEGDETYIDDDDGSSSLSIPNESIDFDLVYSLHSFAATVEGQANVVKGDRLFLIDDSNSYWWLVRVLKTQEVGYIPAENIETPFERLARLNKHRNVDLASATQAEMQGDLNASQDLLRSRTAGGTPSPVPGRGHSRSGKGVQFTSSLSVHRYPPAVWNEEEVDDEDDEWDEGEYFGTDPDLAEEEQMRGDLGPGGMEPDDEMQWDDSAVEEMRAQQAQARAAAASQNAADALQPGAARLAAQQMQLGQQQLQGYTQQQLQQLQQQQALQRQQQEALAHQQQSQQAQWGSRPQELRSSGSRERLAGGPDASRSGAASPNTRQLDPADATVTVRRTITPSVARDDDKSYINRQEDEGPKRSREEEEEAARKRAKGREKTASPAPSTQKPQSGKLRKEPSREPTESETKEKKKRSGVFSSIFGSGKKREKSKEKNSSISSLDGTETATVRVSEESNKSSRPSGSASDGVVSPTTNLAIQQQQQAATTLASVEVRDSPSTPEKPPQVSQHASQLRQHDQQQQALYQQYLNRSPSSAPEAQPSYGLQSASAVLGASYGSGSVGFASGLGPPASRPRPGSLIITSTSADGSGPGVPELSVIRVFAGKNLQTEATFKTVLLNASTTSSDLVRQAIQRFRLPGGESQNDYYLTVKQIEGGSSAVLQDEEHPLVVFETLVNEAMEMPKVKRSSMGSISSVSSNLSMHPAIKKLAMNDFTDDSAVKFYLNRKNDDGAEDSLLGHEDDTILAETSHGEAEGQSPRNQYLSVSTAGINVTPERFSSPSIRFAVQLVIYPEDLPEDMVFHPTTEAIVFKDQLRESEMSATTVTSPHMRRKVFMFPKNVTVAEVTELGLERFGILEGVVDGGDEVEDKLAKRRSSGRVRYGLWISANGQERELTPSSKVVDAYPRPPPFRSPERHSGSLKRRSVDSAQLLGNTDDVQPDDPVFLLRRAISYRNSTSRHRMSAPLDEIALQHLHRESASSSVSDPSVGDIRHPPRQPSAQEIIAAQRAATRANQRAMISAQSNSLRGTDVLLPDNALLRSSRYDSTERMRYSYVEPDGETYDISDIVEAEWRDGAETNKNDLLASVVSSSQEGLGENLDRVLNKIRNGKAKERDQGSLEADSRRESRNSMPSVSEYSVDDSVQATSPIPMRSRSVTPGSAGLVSKMPSGSGGPNGGPTMVTKSAVITTATASIMSANPESSHTHTRSTSSAGTEGGATSRTGTATPTGRPAADRRQPSLASVISESTAGYTTPPPHPPFVQDSPRSFGSPSKSSTSTKRRGPIIPKDDFGISHMMAIIDYKVAQTKPRVLVEDVDVVDERLFGRPVDLESLHPNVRGIYERGFKMLEDMDKILDSYVQPSIGAF